MSAEVLSQSRILALAICSAWIESGKSEDVVEYFHKAVEAGMRLRAELPKVANLTPRQRDLLAFIASYVDQHQYYHGLSLDELARGESYHPGDDA